MKNKLNDHLNSFNSFQLIGLESYFNNCINLYNFSKFPKVLLFSGPKGLGKFTLAFHLINYVLSKDFKNSYYTKNKSINENSSIYKQLSTNASENLIYVSNESHNRTSIEQIREIRKKLNNSTLNNLPRFIIFDDVEQLNVSSANSLLKVIEEPNNTNYFILINNKRAKLIETIKSRSIEINFFLNYQDKKRIFSELCVLNKLNSNFSHKYIKYTTPGLLLKYSKIIDENNINADTEFAEIVSIFLEKYKKTKDEIFLDIINFFLEIKSEKLNANSRNNFLALINQKNNVMKLLYNYKKFNLTNNVVLSFIKKIYNYNV